MPRASEKQLGEVTISVGVARLPDESEVGGNGLVNMNIGKILNTKLSIISNELVEEGPGDFSRPIPKVVSSNSTLPLIIIYYLSGSNN